MLEVINRFKNFILDKKVISIILIFFLMIQPLLDFRFLFIEAPEILGFTIPTMVRVVFMGILGILFVFTLKNKKEILAYIIYAALIILYAVFHHMHALNFTDYYGGYDFNYTLMSEVNYIIRMLMPLAVIAISSHFRVEDKTLDWLLTVLVILICGNIIVTNLQLTSFGSYSKELIKGNIFCWFKSDMCGLSYYDLASMGSFYDANRVAALLALISCMNFYINIVRPSIKNKILLIANMLAMFMIGTKVSIMGFIIVEIMSIVAYLFCTKFKKDFKFDKRVLIYFGAVAILFFMLLPYSPSINRMNADSNKIEEYNKEKKEITDKLISDMDTKISDYYMAHYYDDNVETDSLKLLDEMTLDEQKELLNPFIEDNTEMFEIQTDFIKRSYPYDKDPIFWYGIMKEPIEMRLNYRHLEEAMLKRVKTVNADKTDNLLGITFTRMANIFDFERDFKSHYYTMGILGFLLLLAPYVIVIIYAGIKMIKNFKSLFTIKNIALMMASGITVFAGYFSGNVMDSLVVTLILGFIMGQLINSVHNKDVII